LRRYSIQQPADSQRSDQTNSTQAWWLVVAAQQVKSNAHASGLDMEKSTGFTINPQL
jgi:hypothetical protein